MTKRFVVLGSYPVRHGVADYFGESDDRTEALQIAAQQLMRGCTAALYDSKTNEWTDLTFGYDGIGRS